LPQARNCSLRIQPSEGNAKCGNRYLAWAYVEAANFAIRHDTQVKRWYERKCAKRHRVLALKTLASKIARACYHMLREGTDFDRARASSKGDWCGIDSATLREHPVSGRRVNRTIRPSSPGAGESTARLLTPPAFQPQRIESACDSGLFSTEYHPRHRELWLCTERDAATGRLRTTRWGDPVSPFSSVLRGPISGDRGILSVQPSGVVRLDPVTLDEQFVSVFTQPASSYNAGRFFDRNGDGKAELMLDKGGFEFEVRNYPEGDVVATIPGPPWNGFLHTTLVVQVDADPQHELLHVGNELSVHDGLTLQRQYALPDRFWLPIQALNWDGDAFDEVIASGSPTFWSLSLLKLGPTPLIRFDYGGSGDGAPMGGAAIQLGGDALPELALVWERTVRFIDPRTGSVLRTIPIAPTGIAGGPPWITDYDGNGQDDVLWIGGSVLHWLDRNGSPQRVHRSTQNVQAVARRSGELAPLDGPVVVRLEVEDGQAAAHLEVRDSDTLAVVATRSVAGAFEARYTMGDLAIAPGLELLGSEGDRLRAEPLFAGSMASWESVIGGPNQYRWGPLAVHEHGCVDAACGRILAAQILTGLGTSPGGSRLVLLDGADGSPIWEGPRDNCQGCGHRSVAIADLDGDGEPELLSAKLDPSIFADTVTLLDGATREQRWQRLPGSDPLTVAIAPTSQQSILLATRRFTTNPTSVQLELLSASDGSVIRSRTVGLFGALAFLPFDSDRGVWALAQEERILFVDEDLRGGLRSLPVRGVTTMAAGAGGELVVSDGAVIRLIEVAADTLLVDDFEAEP
jgi:hypothetical protein